MEIIPVHDSNPIVTEYPGTAEKVLLYAEMFSLIIDKKAHNASHTQENFDNFCKIHPFVVYDIKIDIMSCRQSQQNLLMLSLHATCFNITAHFYIIA
jgi:hypothetical protein